MSKLNLCTLTLCFAMTSAAGAADLAKAPESWVKIRVQKSETRLQQQGEAGQLALAAINAHGGLATWFNNGPFEFRFDYQPIGKGKVRDTVQRIDTWSSKARHYMSDNKQIEFGWDGQQAWWQGTAELAVNARFWSLTPYYFVAIPFVFADPGVNLKMVGEGRIDNHNCDLVHVSFSAGTGDSPDDYYIMYVDKQSKVVRGVRYVVSYRGFIKEGTTPEKMMAYRDYKDIQGIKIAHSFETFTWDGSKPGKAVTKVAVSGATFKPETPAAYFEVPKGASIQQQM